MQIIGRYQAPCRFTTEEVFQVWLSVAVLMASRGGLDVSEKQTCGFSWSEASGRNVNLMCASLGFYASYSSSFVPTFRCETALCTLRKPPHHQKSADLKCTAPGEIRTPGYSVHGLVITLAALYGLACNKVSIFRGFCKNFGKPLFSLVMSVRQFVRMEQLGSLCTDFVKIWY